MNSLPEQIAEIHGRHKPTICKVAHCVVRNVREETSMHKFTARNEREETALHKLIARNVREETAMHKSNAMNSICTDVSRHKLPKTTKDEFTPLVNESTQAVSGSKSAMSKEIAHHVRLNRCLSMNDIVDVDLKNAPNYCHQNEGMSKDHVHKRTWGYSKVCSSMTSAKDKSGAAQTTKSEEAQTIESVQAQKMNLESHSQLNLRRHKHSNLERLNLRRLTPLMLKITS